MRGVAGELRKETHSGGTLTKETAGLADLSKLEEGDISYMGASRRSLMLGGRPRKGIKNSSEHVRHERSIRHPKIWVTFT